MISVRFFSKNAFDFVCTFSMTRYLWTSDSREFAAVEFIQAGRRTVHPQPWAGIEPSLTELTDFRPLRIRGGRTRPGQTAAARPWILVQAIGKLTALNHVLIVGWSEKDVPGCCCWIRTLNKRKRNSHTNLLRRRSSSLPTM